MDNMPEFIEIKGVSYQRMHTDKYEDITDFLNMGNAEGQGLVKETDIPSVKVTKTLADQLEKEKGK